MAGRIPRLLSAYPGRTGSCPGIYASYVTGRRPSPTLLGFQLYAISGRAHFRHRPMQLRAIHRGWAHSQAFGGNVSAFNANTTSQAFTRFAQLVWPHGYCWYPPKMKIAPLGLAGGRSYDRTNSLRTPTMKESQLLREKTTSSVFLSTCSNAVPVSLTCIHTQHQAM